MAIIPSKIQMKSSAFLSLETPYDEEVIFRKMAPVAVEVGCGNGHFLTELAQAEPGMNYIGIDIRFKRIEKSCQKVDKRGLQNIRFMLNDANEVLRSYFPVASIATFYVNFPDPWPKYKHRKFRLNQMLFIRLMTRCLQPGGDLWWVCDHYPQIVDVVTLCREVASLGYLENLHEPEGFSLEEPEYPPTLYEKKWRSEGRPIFYVRFRRSVKPFSDQV